MWRQHLHAALAAAPVDMAQLPRQRLEVFDRGRGPDNCRYGAGEGNRTLDTQLGKLTDFVDIVRYSCKPCDCRGVGNQRVRKTVANRKAVRIALSVTARHAHHLGGGRAAWESYPAFPTASFDWAATPGARRNRSLVGRQYRMLPVHNFSAPVGNPRTALPTWVGVGGGFILAGGLCSPSESRVRPISSIRSNSASCLGGGNGARRPSGNVRCPA